MKGNENTKLISSNKKASFDYTLFDRFEAGIALLGTEIKSIRKNGANLKDSYIRISDNLEAYLVNAHISPYEFGNIFNHEPRRERKLLLHKNEILKIAHNIETNRYTLIPLKLYFKKNKIKVELGICQGKKLYDKRESIKERDLKRRIE